MSQIFPLVSFKILQQFYPYLLSLSVAPEEGWSCLTEILGIKCIIIFSRPVTSSIGFIV